MNGATLVWIVAFAVVYFVVLVVVAWEPHEPARQGRHRRDRAEGARIAPVAAPRALVAEVTDARTRRAHLVTERAFAAGCRTGRYTAMCGAEVLAASLATPDVGYCRLCLAQWRAGR